MISALDYSYYKRLNIAFSLQVIQGLLQANEDVIVNRDLCAQLLAHEVTRTFHDRLISPSDREKFYGFLSEMLHDYFKVTLPKLKIISFKGKE
ncbi:DNAH14 [Bugula neritina]|uniref:DNAH14 n=1 Tax=Bugula neritina TaxID=10212 RepID=A0A7J7J9X9_BUGNE|nr:DNAH14 [Bugula neritina]